MDAKPRIIRRVPPHRIADFDDFLWPINAALLVFSGCVAGVIVAKSDFHTPLLIYNGWVRLASLAIVMGLAFWGMMRLDRFWSRRMQLSVLSALIVHLWGAVYLNEQYLAMASLRDEEIRETLDEPPLITLPDYDFQTLEQFVPDESLDDPQLLVVPDVQQPDVPRTDEPSQPTEIRAAEEPARIEVTEPRPMPLERAEYSAPRRSEATTTGQLSRQERPQEILDAPIETPSLLTPTSTDEARIDADVELQRSEANPELANRSLTPIGLAVPTSRQSAARRADDDAPTAETSPERRRSRALASINAPSDASEVAAPLQSAPSSNDQGLQPRDMETGRTVGESSLQRNVTAPGRVISSDASLAATRAATSSGFPNIDAAREAMAARSSTVPGVASERIATPDATTLGESSSAGAELQPLVGQVSRSASVGGSAERRGTAAAVGIESSQPTASARRAGAGATAPELQTGGRNSLTRSASSAGAANAEMASIDVAAPGRAASSGAQSRLGPTNTGLSRASGGLAGLTRQNDYDVELPGGRAPSDLPSAAARRSRATDERPTGAGQNPSSPAMIARARAGADVPSAALRAENVTIADAAGAERVGNVEASSSSAVERRASNAAPGRVTAAAGSSLVDLGTGRSSAAVGDGRSGGGGEPTISNSYQPGRLARAGAGPAIDSSSSGDVEAVGAPAGAGATASHGEGSGPLGPSGGDVARGASGGTLTRRGGDVGESVELSPSSGVAGGSTASARNGVASGGPTVASSGGGLNRRGAAPAEIENAIADDSAIGGAGSGGEQGGVRELSGPRGEAVAVTRSSTVGGHARARGASDVGTGLEGTIGGSNVTAASRRVGGEGNLAVNTRGGASTARAAIATGNVGDDSAELVEMITETDAGAGTTGGQADGPLAESTAIVRQSSTSMVRRSAPEGAGGLGNVSGVAAGVPDRRARPESEVAQPSLNRFVLERSGGSASPIDATADTGPVYGYKQRSPNRRGALAEALGGNAESERAVELGLDYLARHQHPDGHWSLHNLTAGQNDYRNTGAGTMHADTAATGLALLAFYGAGYTHNDGKYRLVVRRGLDHLLAGQKSDGDLFVPQDQESSKYVWFYSHGIAAIALCEAYGMTRDAELREPAQRALDFIVASQQVDGGGWRYSPRAESDTSVSGWQMMAMKSGELAGLKVPRETYDRLRTWLDHAATPWGSPARYAYRPRSKRPSQANPSLAMTAEGLLMQQYLGWQRDNPYLRDGAEFLRKNLPTFGTPTERWRDCYYWYYATQVMFQMQGDYWRDWNERLRPLLIDSQLQEGQFAGSWEPRGETPDRWGPHGGRHYVTCLHLLMLEVYYRHLPLYQDLTVAARSE